MKSKLELARQRIATINRTNNPRVHSRMFLLDTSDSMRGFKLQYAKQALNYHIKSGDGILTFDNNVHYVTKDLIGRIDTNGLTAMLPAIKEAVTYKCSHVILITDGQPNVEGETDDVTDFVRHSIRGIKIDTIGIGDDCELEFLASISKSTGGTNYFIDDPEQLTGIVGLLTAGSSINL